ncbi:MAG: pseudouridine synthase [Bradymonadia bacterium]
MLDNTPSPLQVLHHDAHIVAVNKPPGLLVHRTELDRGETDFALQRVRNQIGRRVYPIHRLDRPTSGVLVFALDVESARALGEALVGHTIDKTYVAVVRGWPPAHSIIDRPLKRLDVPPGTPRQTQEARSEVWSLAEATVPVPVDRFPTTRYGLVAVKPHHGRRHQIRRHLNRLGHPIIGDVRHGKGVHNRFFREHFGVSRLLLHCRRMVIPHPSTGEDLTITAPLDEGFQKVCVGLGWGEVEVSGWRPENQGPS